MVWWLASGFGARLSSNRFIRQALKICNLREQNKYYYFYSHETNWKCLVTGRFQLAMFLIFVETAQSLTCYLFTIFFLLKTDVDFYRSMTVLW